MPKVSTFGDIPTLDLALDRLPIIDASGTGITKNKLISPNTLMATFAGALTLQGNIDASTNPNYPSATKGHTYYITVAGKVGGASGKSVEVGDAVVASSDNAGGTEAAVGTSWFVIQSNLNPTTTGFSFINLTNPSAITFPRINADNTVTALSASAFLAAISGAGLGANTFTDAQTVGGRIKSTINGTAAAPAITFGENDQTGIYCSTTDADISFTFGGTRRTAFGTQFIAILSDSGVFQLGAALDVTLARDAANIFSQKSGTSAQTFRVYGTTTGSKYLNLTHNGTDAIITASSGGVKICSAGTETLSLWGKTPVTQPAAIADAGGGAVAQLASGATVCVDKINAIIAALRSVGIIAT